MLKSADLHETILTPVICHKHVRCQYGVTLYFSMKFPSVAPKKTRNGHFSIYQQISSVKVTSQLILDILVQTSSLKSMDLNKNSKKKFKRDMRETTLESACFLL